MTALLQDLRFGLRTLLRAPGFTTMAVLTLALGIGANSALFSVVNGVLLNPLPYPEPDRLMAVFGFTNDVGRGPVSYLNYLDWQNDNATFSGFAAFRNTDELLTGMGEGERLSALMISAEFFPTLGVQPIAGRVFRKEEDQVGGTPVVMISAGLWQRKFGGAREAVGRMLTLNGQAREIVGVAPANFAWNARARDIYIPIGQWADPTFRNRGVSFGTHVVGRLKPGVTIAQAQADMSRIASTLSASFPDSNKGLGIAILPLKQSIVGDVQALLFVLLGAVSFVLLIACANVANLLLARATGRTREFAIRAALGAGRGRMVRQLLTESTLLAVAGGVAGLAVAYWGVEAALGLLPGALPRSGEIRLDGHVLLFTLGASLLVGVLFGLAPAWRLSREHLQARMNEGGRGSSRPRHRTQAVFVAAEMALALILLAGAGLMIRSLSALSNIDPGFNPHDVLTFNTTLPRGLADRPQAQRALLRQIHDSLMGIPGLQFASLQGGALPMQGESDLPFWIEGHPKPATVQEMPNCLFYLVEPDYLKAMGTPLLRGRFFTDQDNERGAQVAVIDEAFARKYFGGEDPIGKRLNFPVLDIKPEIIGIARHVKHAGLDADATYAIQAQVYLPFMQLPDRFMPLLANGIGVVARIRGPQSEVAPAVRHAMAQINSDQVVYAVQMMDDIIAEYLAGRRFSMTLLGIFAVLALALAGVGIYGVVSYFVGERTHEIGIRMALGAQRADVLRSVLGRGAVMAMAGVGIGLVGALLSTWVLTRQQMLYGVDARDPLTLAVVSVVLMAISLAACWVPAWRAMRTDPLVALRYE